MEGCLRLFWSSQDDLLEKSSNQSKWSAAAYQIGNTSSCVITEVKQCLTRLLLAWQAIQVLTEYRC